MLAAASPGLALVLPWSAPGGAIAGGGGAPGPILGAPGLALVFPWSGWPAITPVPPTGTALAVADAVAALLNAELVGELLGGCYCDEHPPEATAVLPRAVVVDLGGSTAYDTGGPLDESEVQVTVFAATRAAARTLGNLVRSTCTDAAAAGLDPAAGTVLQLRPASPPIVTLDPAKGPGGSDVWRADLTLRAIVEID